VEDHDDGHLVNQARLSLKSVENQQVEIKQGNKHS